MHSTPKLNIGILAHVDAGKTSLTENLLFLSQAIKVKGQVDKGTTQTDFLDVEKERGITVRSAVATFDWKNIQINLIDTPGHVDFSSDVERSLRVLDCAILVISAVDGIQAHTETLWKALIKYKIPTIFFVNKMTDFPKKAICDARFLCVNAIVLPLNRLRRKTCLIPSTSY